MARKKACKKCKYLFDGGECPVCKSHNPSTNWYGRISVLDPEKSFIAEKVSITKKGEYAIKVR